MGERTFCIVPATVSGGTLRGLRRWCEDTGTTLVKEQRQRDRRADGGRRSPQEWQTGRRVDRRKIANSLGRRVGERRASVVPVTAPTRVPRRLRSRDDSYQFIQHLATPPEHLEDLDTARLAIKIQSGQKHLFERIYERYFDRVYAYTRTFAPYAPEEALQEAFFDLYESIASWDPSERPFRAWMCLMLGRRLHGHALAAERLESARPVAPPAQARDRGDAVPDWITDADLLVLMSRLPLAQREVMMLRYLWMLSLPQIANVMEEPADAVSELHARGIEALGERLAGLAPPRESPSLRLAMVRRPQGGRVLHSRRLALTPG
jgi:RNA polymerase sigma factor (sigma-70 family)